MASGVLVFFILIGIGARVWYKFDQKRLKKQNQHMTNMALHQLHHPDRVDRSTVPRPNDHVDHRQFSEVKARVGTLKKEKILVKSIRLSKSKNVVPKSIWEAYCNTLLVSLNKSE